MKCCVCDNKGITSGCIRISDGAICRRCRRYLPYGTSLSSEESENVKIKVRANKEKSKDFDASNSLGFLYIDSYRRLFCVSREVKKGNPVHFGDIYHINDVRGLGLICENVRNAGNGRDLILCDAKLIVRTDKTEKEYIVDKNLSCTYTYEGNKIDWKEPGKFQVIRHLLFQMADDEYMDLQKKIDELNRAKETARDEEITETKRAENWSRGILFLDRNEPLTSKNLRERRNKLIKIFHPDNMKDGERETEMIYNAYNELAKIAGKEQTNG